MTFEIYQPVPVLLPEESGLRREFVTRTPADARPGLVLGDREYAQYDSRTVFYDVFRREEDPRRVVAIGPPPVNLAPELDALGISRDARALRHRLLRYPRFTVVEIALDGSAASERDLELDFAFPSFTARVRVPPRAEEAGAAPRPKGDGNRLLAAQPIAMMTLQKDNGIAWIEDWCRWHRRLHDITRFRIYDNASANIGPLEEALRRLSDEMEVLLVRWPFPYGPSRGMVHNFAQEGALNHYRLRFGARDAWCLLMDVDEYLAASGSGSLRETLAANEREGIVSLIMDSFVLPPCSGQAPVPERRAWHYAWRERRLHGRNEKCVCIPSRNAWFNVHRTLPGTRLFERCLKWWSIGGRLLRYCHQVSPKRIERLERSAAPWRRAGAWWLRRMVPGTRGARFCPPDELFFFHFRGLNTGWSPRGPARAIGQFDPERYVEDPRIRALAEQAGLVPDGTPPDAGTSKGEDLPADAHEGARA